MGWAEKRIDAYRQGSSPNWLELRALEHANPVHVVIEIISAILLITGLWIHHWGYIWIAILLALVGHIYCYYQK